MRLNVLNISQSLELALTVEDCLIFSFFTLRSKFRPFNCFPGKLGVIGA